MGLKGTKCSFYILSMMVESDRCQHNPNGVPGITTFRCFFFPIVNDIKCVLLSNTVHARTFKTFQFLMEKCDVRYCVQILSRLPRKPSIFIVKLKTVNLKQKSDKKHQSTLLGFYFG